MENKNYIAILRGINVSGQKMIKMDALKLMFESMKFKNVKTYIQSGNVVFQDKENDTDALAKKIQIQIQKQFGFEVPVMVKGEEELENVITNNPFFKRKDIDITKLHVTFLSSVPNQTGIDKIKDGNYSDDEYIIVDKAVYLYCPNGYGNTKLNNNFLENKLKVTATTRNWKTVNELFRMVNC